MRISLNNLFIACESLRLSCKFVVNPKQRIERLGSNRDKGLIKYLIESFSHRNTSFYARFHPLDVLSLHYFKLLFINVLSKSNMNDIFSKNELKLLRYVHNCFLLSSKLLYPSQECLFNLFLEHIKHRLHSVLIKSMCNCCPFRFPILVCSRKEKRLAKVIFEHDPQNAVLVQ